VGRAGETAPQRDEWPDRGMSRLRVVPGAIAVQSSVSAGSLESLQREQQLILDAAGEGIYGLDLDGRVRFVNPAAAAMTGHAVQELVGQRMHDVVHHSRADGSHYPHDECPIYAAFQDGMVRHVRDDVFWRRDGSSFDVAYTSTPLIADGKLSGSVVVFRDVTLSKRTEERLRQALCDVQRLEQRLQQENRRLRAQIQASSARELVGESAALAELLEALRRVAPTDLTVLVSGESGTGKELVCRALHEQSPRREQPLVCVNCAAISPALMESELFGHERGAFTGALVQRSGRFEQAGAGTLFLDEIGELPLELQGKLLRVLQEREFERVGGTKTLRSSARIVAATNRDLGALVRAGRFREDLFYRLYVVPLRVPPLRERRADIPLLAAHFLRRCAAQLGRSFDGVSPAALRRLEQHDWPGNVRELEHTIQRAALVCDGTLLELADGILSGLAAEAPASSLAAVEREHVLRILERAGQRISGPGGAAELLGLHPNTLRHRLKKLGIHARRDRGR
jgi:formate hydrogenlyase transcriptional activator